jgi:hypothetical protein
MKLYPLNPLAALGMLNGYTRPLDRHDFPHGTVPDSVGRWIPGMGELKRHANLNLLSSEGAAGQDTWNTNVVTTVQRHPLGTVASSKDGRVFRYGSAGAADLVVGNIVQSAVPVPLHLGLVSAVQNIGDGVTPFPIVVTPGATAGAANLYAEGTLMVDTAPGNGYSYRISGHGAITASVPFNLFLDPDERIQIALSTASRYGLHHNPYKTVLQSPATVTAMDCGGVVTIITGNSVAENFGWLQTRGPFAGLINGTPAVGTGLVTSATTAGGLDVAAVAAEINVRIIARAMQVGVSGKNNAVYLLLD